MVELAPHHLKADWPYLWLIKRTGKAKAHLIYAPYADVDGAIMAECHSWLDSGTAMVPATIYDSVCKVCAEKRYSATATVSVIR